MNVYRNLHFHSLNYQKKAFKELVEPLLRGLPKFERISLEYQIFPQTKRLFDVVNIGSIVDKYFADAMSETGVIPDDNYLHVPSVTIAFGGCVVDQEYVLVTITELKKDEPMKILLDTQDIQNALDTYVLNELGLEGATGVELSADDDGEFSAEVLMGDAPKAAPKKATRKPAARKTTASKPKETADAETSTEGSSAVSGEGSPDTSGTETGAADSTKAEGKESKNPSEESQEESSKADTEADTTSTETAPVKPKKKSSIFDA